MRLEGVVGYCPSCDLHWDARQVEQPEACPYCHAGNVRRYLCHMCQRLTYLPHELTTDSLACPGCGSPFAQKVLPHVCRVLRVEVVTGQPQCPACQEPVRPSAPTTDANAPVVDASQREAEGETQTPSAVDEDRGIQLTGPVRSRELHALYGDRLVRVHFDYNVCRFFRNEKGLFYAYSLGTPPTQYHIIPSWSRFGVAGDFIHWFSEMFDCRQPKGGEIWVYAPAIADAEGKLLQKGHLEVDSPAADNDSPTPYAPPVQHAPPVQYAPPVQHHIHGIIEQAQPELAFQPQPTVVQPLAAASPARRSEAPPSGNSLTTLPTKAPANGNKNQKPPRMAYWPLWLIGGVFIFSAIGIGLGIFLHLPDRPVVQSAPASPVLYPNQPQTANQTNQEAIWKALDGMTLAFNAQETEAYATYFDRTLRPYGKRREAPARQMVDDLRKLSENYTVTMAHETPQVEVNAKGTQATVRANRVLTGRHRQTGQVVQDMQRVTYRFVRQGSYWLIAGTSHPVALPVATPRSTRGKS